MDVYVFVQNNFTIFKQEIMRLIKSIAIITIAISSIGCSTNRVISYGADINDSTFIYIRHTLGEFDHKNDEGLLCEQIGNDLVGCRYMYWIKNDSIYLDDESRLYDPWPINVSKKKIIIYKNNNKEALFYNKEDLDSIVFHKVSESYIDSKVSLLQKYGTIEIHK